MHVESLEVRRLLAGVTLITHGWNGTTDGWIDVMTDRIIERVGEVGSVAEYKLSITGSTGSPNTATLTRISPIDWSNASSGHAIIKLDWSTLAGGLFPSAATSTGAVATFATNWLLNNTIGGVSFASVPIHLMGHSRGAALINGMARRLGEQGIVVDHATFLDPHPVDGIRDPLGLNFGDEPMNLPASVRFADNYWRTDGDTSFDFTGEPVTGALNFQLNESLMASGGYSNEHSDVHLWYHGTIDLRPTASNGDFTVPNTWHAAPNPGPRHAHGWNYSRGARSDGAAGGIGIGFGGSASRVSVSLNTANPRANLTGLSIASAGPIAPSGELAIGYRLSSPGASTLRFWLDNNRNPFDGGRVSVAETAAPSSGAWPTSAVLSVTGTLPNTLAEGLYHLQAESIDALGRSRWTSIPQPIYIRADGFAEITTLEFADHLGSGAWGSPGNWLGTRVPSPADRALTTRSLTISTGDVVSHLRLANGATMNWNDGTLAGVLGVSSGATLQLAPGITLASPAGAIELAGNAQLGSRRIALDRATLLSTGTLHVATSGGAIGGLAANAIDLAGTLSVNFPTVPAPGSRFELFAGPTAGAFAAITCNLPALRLLVPIDRPDRFELAVSIVGDLNLDGTVNNLDIAPFVQGLTSPESFVSTLGYSPQQLGDINGDGAFNNLDIAPFVALLTGGRATALSTGRGEGLSQPPQRGSTDIRRGLGGLFGSSPRRTDELFASSQIIDALAGQHAQYARPDRMVRAIV